MKKDILKNSRLIVIIVVLIAMTIGFIVGNNKGPINGKLVCKYSSDSNTMNNSFEYNMKFKMRNVTRLETIENISSDDVELLKTYMESLEELTKKYQDLKYYNVDMSLKNNNLIVKTTIDYDKLDMNKYLKIEGEKVYIKNKKVKVIKLKEIYEKNGASCKYSK